MSRIPYDDDFFDEHEAGMLASADVVVPIVVELCRPNSVVDVGCGRGIWLRVFQENGITLVKGLDGEYIDRSRLFIDPHLFVPIDLRSSFKLEQRCDLALCLEVAEHIPASKAAALIESLTDAAPVVLFFQTLRAAILMVARKRPLTGGRGRNHHPNAA